MARRTGRKQRKLRQRKAATKRTRRVAKHVTRKRAAKREHFVKSGVKKAAIYFIAAATVGIAYWYLRKMKKA